VRLTEKIALIEENSQKIDLENAEKVFHVENVHP
jgi:hypothetical protein